MKYSLALLLALLFCGVCSSAEVVVQEPLFTITGHYRDGDGRVKEHKFPVEFKLRADGAFTGTIESWIEKTLSDGNSRLSYSSEIVTGRWTIKDNSIHIIMEQGPMFPQMVFEKMNGLAVTIERKENPNKPDSGSGATPEKTHPLSLAVPDPTSALRLAPYKTIPNETVLDKVKSLEQVARTTNPDAPRWSIYLTPRAATIQVKGWQADLNTPDTPVPELSLGECLQWLCRHVPELRFQVLNEKILIDIKERDPGQRTVRGVLRHFPSDVKSPEAWHGHNFLVGDTPVIATTTVPEETLKRFIGLDVIVTGVWHPGEQLKPTEEESNMPAPIHPDGEVVVRGDGIKATSIKSAE